MTEWISVKDRLPEKGQTVGTFSQKLMDIGDFPLNYHTFFNVEGKWPGGELISHWLPLPEPPK